MYLHLLSLLQFIPKGAVTTYGDLSTIFGIPHNARAIGKILRENKDLNKYPCYKVVGHDGALTGYAGGMLEKERRLRADGIIVQAGKVIEMEKRRWKPMFHSFFLALPLDEQNKNIFSEAYDKVLPLFPHPSPVSFQSPETPHVTIQYYGDISFDVQCHVVEKLQHLEQNKLTMEPLSMHFQHLDFFGHPRQRRVAFFTCQQGMLYGKSLQQRITLFLGIPEDRPYIPHLTFFRIKHPQRFCALEEKIMSAVEDDMFTISPTLIRWYAAMDQKHQIPFIDFSLF